jgi:hypothetical protein
MWWIVQGGLYICSLVWAHALHRGLRERRRGQACGVGLALTDDLEFVMVCAATQSSVARLPLVYT